MLLSVPSILFFVKVDHACVFLLLVEIGYVVNVLAIVCVNLHNKVTTQWPC